MNIKNRQQDWCDQIGQPDAMQVNAVDFTAPEGGSGLVAAAFASVVGVEAVPFVPSVLWVLMASAAKVAVAELTAVLVISPVRAPRQPPSGWKLNQYFLYDRRWFLKFFAS